MLDPTAIRQIKETLQESIDNNEIAGGNLLLIEKESETFYHEDGFADREAGLQITRESISDYIL